MIELMLQAERALTSGMIDQAERLYWQAVEADAHNAIAVTGLARVALERADDRTAYVFARKALAIDPENPAAQRLVTRLEEVMAYRGEAVPVVDVAGPMPVPSAATPAPAMAGSRSEAATTPAAEARTDSPSAAEHGRKPEAPQRPTHDHRRSLIGRILGRRG